jgi:hypothetical protein
MAQPQPQMAPQPSQPQSQAQAQARQQARPAIQLTPEQRALAQAQMIGTMQAIGAVLGTRLVLLISVLIAAGLAFTAAIMDTTLSAIVFGSWCVLVVAPICALDVMTRRGGG